MKDLFGKALWDYYHKNQKSDLTLHNKFSEADALDLEGYFFDENDFSDIEEIAMEFSDGKVLDVGAAAGRHTLYLEALGINATALDISGHCVELMKKRKVSNVIQEDIYHHSGQYDTIIMLLNGIGMVGTIDGLRKFLNHAKSLIASGGKIIFDSSDISYLKEDYKLPEKEYFGEIDYCYEYDGEMGEWFSWLYIEQDMLIEVSDECGWNAKILFEDDDNQYLALLTEKNPEQQ